MKIAITGGTGFIGSALVERLTAEGHQVTVLTRRPDIVRGRLPQGAEPAFFSTSVALSDEVLREVEAVVHLAGDSLAQRWTPAQKARALDSRVDGTGVLARAAASSRTVRTFLSASAIGYYGDRGDEVLTERSAPGNDFLAGLCQAWENAAAPAKVGPMRVAQARIGIVLHPSGGALKKMLTPFKLGAGGPVSSGRQYMSWIHRDDLVSLFTHLLLHSRLEGPVNAVAPNPVTNQTLTRALGAALHRPAVLRTPAFALKLAFGEMSTLLLDSQRVLPERALADGFTFAYPTVESALSNLFGRRAA